MENVSDFELEAIKEAALSNGATENRISIVLTDKQAQQIKDRSGQLKHESSKLQISDDKKKKQVEQCWNWKQKRNK